MEEARMYQLYMNRSEGKLEVKILTKIFKDKKGIITDDVVHFNNNYSFSNNRKKLIEYARGLKQEWLKEAQDTVDKVTAIKI